MFLVLFNLLTVIGVNVCQGTYKLKFSIYNFYWNAVFIDNLFFSLVHYNLFQKNNIGNSNILPIFIIQFKNKLLIRNFSKLIHGTKIPDPNSKFVFTTQYIFFVVPILLLMFLFVPCWLAFVKRITFNFVFRMLIF